MSLSRFQLSNDAADVADSKNLSVVLAFNATGVFNVVCKVEDFKYSVYYACPLRPKGRPCGRKLSDNNTCGGCGVKITEPLQNLLVRLVLQDIEQPQILQQATMFSATAERFLGLKAVQLSGNSDDGLDTILTKQLEEKLGLELNVKMNIKKKQDKMDWIVNRFTVVHCGGGALNNKKEEEKEDEDGTEEPPAKKPKIN